MACGLHYDSFLKNHDPGAAHPERSNRASFVYLELEKSGLLDKTLPLETLSCEIAHLERVHSPHYLRQVQKEIEEGKSTLSTGDTNVSSDSWKVALRATGTFWATWEIMPFA